MLKIKDNVDLKELEKYDRGIIKKEEWQKIEDLIGKEV